MSFNSTQIKSWLALLALISYGPIYGQDKEFEGFKSKMHKDTLISLEKFKSKQSNSSVLQRKPDEGNRFKTVEYHQQPFSKTSQLSGSGGVKVKTSGKSGLPVMIEVDRSNTNLRKNYIADLKTATFSFLEEINTITGIAVPSRSFKINSLQQKEKGGSLVRLSQTFEGVEVYGSEIIVHLNSNNEGELFTGQYLAINKNISVLPDLSEQSAVEAVEKDLKPKTLFSLTDNEKKLLEYTAPEVKLIVYEDKSLITSVLLAYEIKIRPNIFNYYKYIVDAKSGVILKSLDLTCNAGTPSKANAVDLNGVTRTINTLFENNTYYLQDNSRQMYNPVTGNGAIITLNAKNTSPETAGFRYEDMTSANNTWANRSAVSAHYNAGIAYEYYRTVHGRNSIDDKNGSIYSFVDVADADGKGMDNAFWNGKFMYYGNGRTGFKPLAGSLDVAGHEMTHGVIQNSAGLEYEGESGAINESMADIFGCLMDSTDWLLGEDVVNPTVFPSGALRNMQDPHNGNHEISWQPAHMNEKYNGREDNGGVHINSGIVNKAFYLYATKITRKKAGKVYYKALTEFLTMHSQFVDLRRSVIKSAELLFGANSFEAIEAANAFTAVGIGEGEGTDYETEIPTNPGEEYLIFVDTDTYSLFHSTPDTETIKPLSSTGVNHKPSVSDDGSGLIFVTEENQLKAIEFTSGNSEEFFIDTSRVWQNAAISKDGRKIALTTIMEDTAIYVIDLETEEAREFKLYNPTYTEGVKTGGPIYADAIEWDITGEFLVYDCYNKITNIKGDSIFYWDVNFIKVWDNNAQNFADGEISKLFASLPDGISIGNPTFSKNSPHIMAFDQVDELNEIYSIVGINIETGVQKTIYEHNILGFPSYSKNDDKLAFAGENVDGIPVVATVELNEDKISPKAEPAAILGFATWPVFYATGERPLNTQKNDNFNSTIIAYPNPAETVLNITFKGMGTVELFDIVGNKMDEFKGVDVISADIENLESGIYILRVKTNNEEKSLKVVKK